MNSEELLNTVVTATEDKKAEDIVSFNMQGINDMTDYFVVYHDNNERQVQSVAGAVKEKVHESNIEARRTEGYQSARRVLTDLTDVVVHIFHKGERNYYNIEKLYQDTPIESYNQVAY